MDIEVGYVVSDLVVTGPNRGAYLVWVPKKQGDPTGKSSYNGFGSNLGNLGSAELAAIRDVAEYCFPIQPLQSGGHMPFNEQNGYTSGTEINSDISLSNVPTVGTDGSITKVDKVQHNIGNDQEFQLRQTSPQYNMLQVYSPEFASGITLNTHADSPSSNYVRLSLGTKVAVQGDFIVGQLPQTNNDIINQMRPLNLG